MQTTNNSGFYAKKNESRISKGFHVVLEFKISIHQYRYLYFKKWDIWLQSDF